MNILEPKNSVNEMKKCSREHQHPVDQREGKINEIEDRNFEITQSEEKKNEESWETIKKNPQYTNHWSSRGRSEGKGGKKTI